MNCKGLEGRGHCLLEALFLQLLGWDEENHEKPQSIWSVSQQRFERSTSRIKFQTSAATVSRSVSPVYEEVN
jgi:hypothetical protein